MGQQLAAEAGTVHRPNGEAKRRCFPPGHYGRGANCTRPLSLMESQHSCTGTLHTSIYTQPGKIQTRCSRTPPHNRVTSTSQPPTRTHPLKPGCAFRAVLRLVVVRSAVHVSIARKTRGETPSWSSANSRIAAAAASRRRLTDSASTPVLCGPRCWRRCCSCPCRPHQQLTECTHRR